MFHDGWFHPNWWPQGGWWGPDVVAKAVNYLVRRIPTRVYGRRR